MTLPFATDYVDGSFQATVGSAGTLPLIQADPSRTVLLVATSGPANTPVLVFKGGQHDYRFMVPPGTAQYLWTWKDHGFLVQREVVIIAVAADVPFYVYWCRRRK